jgi:putative transposase
MEETARRKEAVRRCLAGEKVNVIYRELKTSRKWFYKWYNRYRAGAADWHQDQSKAPKRQPAKIDEEVERLVLKVRQQLEQTKYAQIGASAVARHIRKLGGVPPPAWAINRILKRNGKIRPKEKGQKNKSNVAYTWFTDPFYPGAVHQSDLIGPRYLKGDGRFYCLATIDRFSHSACCVPMRAKDDDSIVQALITTWRQMGVPEHQQFDNELSFQGSNRYPHSLGKVQKLCLAAGVQPVFIPAGEPWRNGMIERFNGTFDRSFFRAERFADFEHFKERLTDFITFHNNEHIYSTNHGKTPNQVLNEQNIKAEKLADDFQFDEQQTLPYESYIHFIRFIRSDLKLRIRRESFPMPKEAMYQYVKATIYTERHLLNVFVGDIPIAQFDYPLLNFNQEDPAQVLASLRRYLAKLRV